MARTGKGKGHRGSGAAPKPGPLRTCCGCGEQGSSKRMVRLFVGPDGLQVDIRAKGPGRGAWVHARGACVAAVEKKPGALGRSLRTVPEVVGLREAIESQLVMAALEGLSMAAAGGALVGGRDLLTKAIRTGRVVHLVVADDASERTVGEYRQAGGEGLPLTVLPIDGPTLGTRIGKGPRAAVGVKQTTAATHLLRQLRRLRDLG